jgi:hypothetical protein
MAPGRGASGDSEEFEAMERAGASIRRALVSAGLTAACLGAAAVGAPALAMDDTSTLTSVLGVFGYSEGNDEKIVYRDRARLVLPPNRQALPEPRTRSSAHPAAWPADQDVSAPAPAQQTGAKQSASGSEESGPTKCMVRSADGACLIVTDADEPGTTPSRRSLTPANATSESRRHLTEPPAAYREHVAGGKGAKDSSDEEAAWYNPGALFGRVFGN